MKKYFILFLSFSLLIGLNAAHLYHSLDYQSLTVDPVSWNPQPGVYQESIFVTLSSKYGKIYYFLENDLSSHEPITYRSPLFLKGEKDYIKDYQLMVLVEKSDGTIELYSKLYRIDMTRRPLIEKKEQSANQVDHNQFQHSTKRINRSKTRLTYQFEEKNYQVRFHEKKIYFPPGISQNPGLEKEITIDSAPGTYTQWITAVSYPENNKIKTEYEYHEIDQIPPQAPSFGSLYWGQVYKQSYKIQIRPQQKGDQIYYWLREWRNEDFIFGPPAPELINRWQLYQEPIQLNSKYGIKGIMGIAAFSKSENGLNSKVSGPFYFKVTELDEKFEQIFKEDSQTRIKIKTKKNIYLNQVPFQSGQEINSRASLKFDGYETDEMFYLAYDNDQYVGKSSLLPCQGEYQFINEGTDFFKLNLYYSNGEKIGHFVLLGDITLPRLKEYHSNYIEASSDRVFEFYMPEHKVRYNATTHLKKYLTIDQSNAEFKGKLKVTAKENQEVTYKIKFASFDENDRIIAESGYYYFKVDKKMPSPKIQTMGINFSLDHNEKQILKLNAKNKNDQLYYKLDHHEKWILYESPLIFYPPLLGQYEVKIHLKSIDTVGNETIIKDPHVLRFDRRALFVNTKLKYSGNGTEKSPVNSLERAITFARQKNIKIIYLLSESIDITRPLIIDSDIVIQPYQKDFRPNINFLTQSIWRKKSNWIEVTKNGYLELRNLDIYINGGQSFIKINQAMNKLYNNNITYSGTDNFCFADNQAGSLGINQLQFNVINNPGHFSFIKSRSGQIILKQITSQVIAQKIDFFQLQSNPLFEVHDFALDLESAHSFQFCEARDSNLDFKSVSYRQKGDFTHSNLYDLKQCRLNISESDFIVQSNQAFEIRLIEQHSCQSHIQASLFRVRQANSVIGVNSFNSEINFLQSMLDIQNVSEYIYSFRMEKSKLAFHSSIIRNLKSESVVTFLLNESTFEGANNSIFNIDIKSRGFNFWINHFANLSSVNSFYYFNRQNEKNAFIYLNNMEYDVIKPILLSNAITSNIVTLENLVKKDARTLISDFQEKNIYYDFSDHFKLNEDDFFIPQVDSPLLQGGIDSLKSPIMIPEYDFYGNNRVLQGYGIDIGAVQKTGYEEKP